MLTEQIVRIKAAFPKFKDIPDAQFKNKDGEGEFSREKNFVVVLNEKGEEDYFIKIHNIKEEYYYMYNGDKTEALQNYLHHHTFPQKTPNTQFVEDTEGFIYVSEHLKNSEEKRLGQDINQIPLSFMTHTNLNRDTEIRRNACNKFVFGNVDVKPNNSVALQYLNKEEIKVYDIDVLDSEDKLNPSVEDLKKYTLKEICLGIVNYNVFLKELNATTDEKEILTALQKVSSEYPERVKNNIEALKQSEEFKAIYPLNKEYIDNYLDHVTKKMNVLAKVIEKITKEYNQNNEEKISTYQEQTDKKREVRQAAAALPAQPETSRFVIAPADSNNSVDKLSKNLNSMNIDDNKVPQDKMPKL